MDKLLTRLALLYLHYFFIVIVNSFKKSHFHLLTLFSVVSQQFGISSILNALIGGDLFYKFLEKCVDSKKRI